MEYEDWRAAEEAYRRLHGKPFGTGVIKLQWARSGRKPDFDRDRRDYAPSASSRFVDPRDVERRATEASTRRSSRSPEQQRRTSRSPPAPRRSNSRSPRYDADVDMSKQR